MINKYKCCWFLILFIRQHWPVHRWNEWNSGGGCQGGTNIHLHHLRPVPACQRWGQVSTLIQVFWLKWKPLNVHLHHLRPVPACQTWGQVSTLIQVFWLKWKPLNVHLHHLRPVPASQRWGQVSTSIQVSSKSGNQLMFICIILGQFQCIIVR